MVNREAVNCEQVWQEISNYIEGEVEPGLRSAMDEHFRTCKRCSSVLEGTRNVIALYSDERMIEVPAGFGRRLEKRLARNARESGGTRWSSWSAWLVPVAALALFAGALRVANSLTAGPELKSEHAQPGEGIPPDMLVVVTADAKVFHVAGCGVIHNKATERTLTAKEAMEQGYVPCLRCMREYLHTTAAGHIALEPEADVDADADEEIVLSSGRQ
ncbi:MAG: anti-sigma factor family protein [Candidatus Sulfotelmatobacter sp.]